MSFAAHQDNTGEESGCIAWETSSAEYMISAGVHPCPAPTCYCTA